MWYTYMLAYTMYANLFWHIESLKDPFVIVADSEFQAKGELDGKIKNWTKVSMGKQRQMRKMHWPIYVKVQNGETALLQDASKD